jgi:phenylalanyl-tRNA synthetase alpha chain
MSNEIEKCILEAIEKRGKLSDHREFAKELKMDEQTLVGSLKSLECDNYLILTTLSEQKIGLSEEAKIILSKGQSLEAEIFAQVSKNGTLTTDLETTFGKEPVKIFLGQAMKNKWVSQKKDTTGQMVVRLVDAIQDETYDVIKKMDIGAAVDPKVIESFKKRKLLVALTIKHFEITKGPNFSTTRKKPESDITSEMLHSGEWKNLVFKDYNFNAK